MSTTMMLIFSVTVVVYALIYFFKPLRLIKNEKARFFIDAGLHLPAILYFLYIGLEPKHSMMIVFAVLGIFILYKKTADYLKPERNLRG